jgi:hypothetical protein
VEDRPELEAIPPKPMRPAPPPFAYPARSRLTRQTPQTVLLVGIAMVLLLCVLSVILAGAGAETAAGLFIICGGPFALFVLGTGIILLITQGRTDRFRK